MSQSTTIKLNVKTKKALDLLKIHRRESYDDVLRKLIKNEKERNNE